MLKFWLHGHCTSNKKQLVNKMFFISRETTKKSHKWSYIWAQWQVFQINVSWDKISDYMNHVVSHGGTGFLISFLVCLSAVFQITVIATCFNAVCLYIQMCCGSCKVWLCYSDDTPAEVHVVYLAASPERKWLYVVLHEKWMQWQQERNTGGGGALIRFKRNWMSNLMKEQKTEIKKTCTFRISLE